ncbi:YdcF family protein [Gracilinema caldarium]|uniref:DUF218 domain-containing protein n=1 Tax=Gracilinema caldarium (strain ATCC 51460 / DSM 7334 / H1) TaxID=744872 RepID=F8EYC6_GRAC1|nr:YdcF family protein [Gracilinema caldarium]AEJ18285.1 protein of unknown function DUF218 [Gracilinema caldarium DSM 7334]
MGTILFYISKILRPLFTSPLPVCLGFALWALIVLKPRNRLQIWLRRIGLCIILGTSVVSLPLVVRLISQWYEIPRSFTGATLDELTARGPYRAILLLGGTVDPVASQPGQVEANDSFERIVTAAALYRAGAAPVIIASGGSGSITFPDQREAPYMAELLEFMGVPKNVVIIEEKSRNTYENIIYSKAILETLRDTKNDTAGAEVSDRTADHSPDGRPDQAPVLLVSSAWHLPRAMAICRKQGLDVQPFSVDSQAEPLLLPADLFPDPWALQRTTRLIREWIGLAYYRLLGRI